MVENKIMARILLLSVLLFLGACAGRVPGNMGSASAISGLTDMDATYAGNSVSLSRGTVDSGLLVPDGDGGMLLLPGSGKTEEEGYVDARELRLQIRELGEQLVAGMNDCSLQGTVALPTSFVDLGDFDSTSALGRLIAEQLYHELHQRGFAVREYRIPGSIRLRKQEGEFALSREAGRIALKSNAAVLVAGTYQYDRDAIFVNARLIKPGDGLVLRTASIVLRTNELTRRMAYSGNTTSLKKLAGSCMRVRDFNAVMQPRAPSAQLAPFDRGEDIH